MTTDLFRHVGMFEHDVNVQTLFNCFKAGFFFVLMSQFIIYYHILSIASRITIIFFPETTNEVMKTVACLFWTICIYYAEISQVQFKISGDEVDSESSIVISNHQSLADHIAIAYLARKSSSQQLLQPRVNFFSWFAVWRVPTLRILLNLTKSDENWELDAQLSDNLFAPVIQSKIPEWICHFPEVNIWSQKDSNLVRLQCEKYFLPKFENALYPRFPGFLNLIATLNSFPQKFTRLYDITLSYTKEIEPFGDVELSNLDHSLVKTINAPSLLHFFTGSYENGTKLVVNIHVKAKLVSRIPKRRKKLERWLEKLWVEKEKRLALQKIGYIESPTVKTAISH